MIQVRILLYFYIILSVLSDDPFKTVTKPFFVNFPPFPPNGPAQYISPIAIPQGGGTLGISSHIGKGFQVSNFPILTKTPTNDDFLIYQNTSDVILQVSDVILDWTSLLPGNHTVITITQNKGFLAVGTQDSFLIFVSVDTGGTGPITFRYDQPLLSTTQRVAAAVKLTSHFTLSDFCDFDNDGLRQEYLIGGASGQLILAKSILVPAAAPSTSFLDIVLTGYTNFITAANKFSKPTCFDSDPTELAVYVAVGYAAGNIKLFAFGKTTNVWSLVTEITFNPSDFVNLGTGPGSELLFAKPAFIDLDYDSKPDGVAVGFRNAQMALLFAEFSASSGGGGCANPPSCALGMFQLGCACVLCPAGTYRSTSTLNFCTICSSPTLYCPEGAIYPQTLSVGTCSQWKPYPSPDFPTLLSPDFPRDFSYYNGGKYASNGGAKVFLDAAGTTSIIVNSFWNPSAMISEMFGGMKQWRNSYGTCPNLELDPVTYQNIPGANPGHGIISSSLVIPSTSFIGFDLKNSGGTSMNVSFSFPPGIYFMNVIQGTSRTIVTYSKTTIPAGSNMRFEFLIDTAVIPRTLMTNDQLNLTVEILNQPYWSQLETATGSEYYPSKNLTLKMQFVAAQVLVVPNSLTVEMQTATIQSRTFQVYSLTSHPQSLTSSVTYITNPGGSSWLTVTSLSNNIGSISVCTNSTTTCGPKPQTANDFSVNVEAVINTNGLFNEFYSAQISINSFIVSINLQVTGGLVDWGLSTLQWFNDGTPVATSSDPQYRVDSYLELQVTPRDNLGNPTSNLGTAADPNLLLIWEYDNSTKPCPVSTCTGQINSFSKNVMLFSARFNVFAAGNYYIRVFDPSRSRFIGTSTTMPTITMPNTIQISPKVCSDANAIPDSTTGALCSCLPGYGIQSGGGQFSDVVCEQCGKGSFSGDGSTSCQACPRGYYTENVGSSECIRCDNYLSTPDPSAQSCRSCNTIEFVDPDDEFWSCVGCGENQRRRVVRNSSFAIIDFPHPTIPNKTINKYQCACNANMYWNSLKSKCITCPTGGFCVDRDESTILPRFGYWGPYSSESTSPTTFSSRRNLATNITTTSNNSEPLFIECRRPESCPGIIISDGSLSDDYEVFDAISTFGLLANGSIGCTACETGYTGPLCFKCDAGYTRAGTNTCTECLSSSAVVGLLCLGAFFAILTCIYIIRRTLASIEDEGKNGSDEMILLRLLMSHLQSESMVQGIDLSWPAFVLSMFQIFDLISSTGQSAFSLDCFVNPEGSFDTSECEIVTDGRLRTFFLSAAFIAALPVIGFIVSSCYWFGRFLYIKRTTGKGRGRSFHQYNLVSLIIIVFLLYPSLSRTGFKFFSCSTEVIQGNRFVEADFNIVCWSPEHLRWAFTLGLSMVIVYAFGVPFGFLYILKTRRQESHRYGKVFTFLYTGFKDERYYWEVVIMFRKLGIAACSTLLKPNGADIQAFGTAIVVFIAVCFQLHIRPYLHDRMNFIETFGLITLFMTLFLGLFQSSASTNLGYDSDVHLAFGIIIVLINTMFLSFVFLQLLEVTFRATKKHGFKHFFLSLVMMKAPPVKTVNDDNDENNAVATVVSSAKPSYDDMFNTKFDNNKIVDISMESTKQKNDV